MSGAIPDLPHRMLGMVRDIAPAPEYEAALDRRRNELYRAATSSHVEGPEHVLVGHRQEGKTRLALDWLMNPPEGVKRILLVMNEDYAALRRQELGLKYRDDRIRSWRSLRTLGAKADPNAEYGIDDADEVLSQLLGIPKLRLVAVGAAEPWQGNQP
ncbi:hypothetical protein [Pseudoclavibacter helvolus]|uniref:hypothetical protein n=1 Tax=Pseudoclavibacter helvolus TaxID=255205 RepID=UPI003736CC2E